jgi:tetratricopeptide (TPR) repeat protein
MADLSDVLLTEEIRSLHQARRTGFLAVSSRDVAKALFFRNGLVQFASSNLEKDKLGENLIRLGRISRTELAAASEVSQNKKERLGRALVHVGVLTEDELSGIVAQQVQRIALSLFVWTKGEIHFHAADDPFPHDLAVDVSTHRLLFEGARIYPDAVRLEAALGNFGRPLRPASAPPFDYSRLPFSPAETIALEAIADGRTIREILGGSDKARSLRARAVYTLLIGGILEEVTEEPPSVATEGNTLRFVAAASPEGTVPHGHASPGERADAAAEGQAEVLNLLEEARSLLTQGDRDGAIPLLLEALGREPGDRTSRRLLALTLAQHRTLFRIAERHFLIALEQEPDDLELRYRLGVYYQTKAALPDRAQVQLELVLKQDSRHEAAQRDLAALRAEVGRKR